MLVVHGVGMSDDNVEFFGKVGKKLRSFPDGDVQGGVEFLFEVPCKVFHRTVKCSDVPRAHAREFVRVEHESGVDIRCARLTGDSQSCVVVYSQVIYCEEH